MAWPGEAFRMPTDATTAEFVPVIYSTKVINHVRSNLIAVQVCNTSWKEQMAKGDQILIPVMSTTSARDVDPQTDLLSAALSKGFGETRETLTIGFWKENPLTIDDSTATQTQVPNLLDIMADNAAYGLEKAIDIEVNELFDDCTNTWAGSDGQTFSDDLFITLQEGLDEGDVPRQNRSLVGDPSMVADIYKIDKFMSYDYSKKPFTTDAYVGTLPAYNVPVFVSNNLENATTGNYGILLHREAIGVVIQSAPKVERWREPKFHADVVNISAFFGVAVLRATFGAEFYTRKKSA